MFRSFLLIFLVLTTSACAKRTMVRSSPDYVVSLERAKTTLILDPKVEVNSIDAFNKSTRMHAYEQQLASTIIDVLIEKLEKKGYRSRHLSRREVREHQLLRDIDNIEDSVEDAMLELYATGAWVEEKAFAINKNVQGGCAVNKTLNADLLVILSFHSNTKTSGAIAKDIAQAMLIGSRHSQNNVEASYLKIAIIEAATNKIVWTHSITAIDGLFGMEKVEQKRFSKLFDMALKELPSV